MLFTERNVRTVILRENEYEKRTSRFEVTSEIQFCQFGQFKPTANALSDRTRTSILRIWKKSIPNISTETHSHFTDLKRLIEVTAGKKQNINLAKKKVGTYKKYFNTGQVDMHGLTLYISVQSSCKKKEKEKGFVGLANLPSSVQTIAQGSVIQCFTTRPP